MRIVVGSQSRSKLEAVRDAAGEMLDPPIEVFGYRVDSGVPDQPIGLEQTAQGALNRAQAALEADETAELGVGLEGGMHEVLDGGKHLDFGVAIVLGRAGVYGIGVSQGYNIPDDILFYTKHGMELSEAVEMAYPGTNTIYTRDCSDVITGGELPSRLYYAQPTKLAILDYSKTLWHDKIHKAVTGQPVEF